MTISNIKALLEVSAKLQHELLEETKSKLASATIARVKNTIVIRRHERRIANLRTARNHTLKAIKSMPRRNSK